MLVLCFFVSFFNFFPRILALLVPPAPCLSSCVQASGPLLASSAVFFGVYLRTLAFSGPHSTLGRVSCCRSGGRRRGGRPGCRSCPSRPRRPSVVSGLQKCSLVLFKALWACATSGPCQICVWPFLRPRRPWVVCTVVLEAAQR